MRHSSVASDVSPALARGLYRRGLWAWITYDGYHRIAVERDEYERQGYDPPFASLMLEDDFHERMLGHRPGEPL